MRFSKPLIAFIIFLNIAYAAACMYVFLKTGAEPTVLTASWYGFTTGELWLVATIKKNKIKKEAKHAGLESVASVGEEESRGTDPPL